MPFKVNPAGVMPIIFAQSLVILPAGFLGYVAQGEGTPGWISTIFGGIANLLQIGSFAYVLFYIALIVFFTYFWTSLMFNPVEIASNMKENGSFIPGIRPGKRTAEYLGKIMKRITLASAAFLAGHVDCSLRTVATVTGGNLTEETMERLMAMSAAPA